MTQRFKVYLNVSKDAIKTSRTPFHGLRPFTTVKFKGIILFGKNNPWFVLLTTTKRSLPDVCWFKKFAGIIVLLKIEFE